MTGASTPTGPSLVRTSGARGATVGARGATVGARGATVGARGATVGADGAQASAAAGTMNQKKKRTSLSLAYWDLQ